MDSTLQNLYNEYFNILTKFKLDEKDLDYNRLEEHIRFLKQLDSIENSSMTIFDLYKRDHIFYSSNFQSLYKWDVDRANAEGHQYSDLMIHPGDLVCLIKAGIYFLRMFFNMNNPLAKKDFKFIADYRIKSHDGNYVRIIEQQTCLETDRNGTPWLILGITDLSPDMDSNAPMRIRVINYKTNEVLHFDPNELEEKKTLSRREKEILLLISQGLASKEIANKLFISTNTVNTHRQNIIEKLNTSNTFEAINYASKFGMI